MTEPERPRAPRDSTSEMIDREIERDQKIRGWLGCLSIIVVACCAAVLLASS